MEGFKLLSKLRNQATYHALTRHDCFLQQTGETTPEAFVFKDKTTSQIFQGIMPDTGASGVSSAGEEQVAALLQLKPSLKIDPFSEGRTITFGKGSAPVIGTLQVPTPVGTILFHVVPLNTPFLFCLQDMDRLQVMYDNLQNILIQGDRIVPILRKWGHPWMLLDSDEAWEVHLSEGELKILHRRFGHADSKRLANLLERAGQEFEMGILKEIQQFCRQCQLHEKGPGRFKFTLKDDHEFNFSIYIDVFYIDGKPVLHVVDSGTAFHAAAFLKDEKARTLWETLCLCWNNAYIGPPDQIVHDAGPNFSSAEFRQLAKDVFVAIKEVPVEAHNSVGKVERGHTQIRRAYEILSEELAGQGYSKEMLLQMSIKVVNDTAGPDGIVPTLLVFGVYPRMTDMDAPHPSVQKRALAIMKATKEVRRLTAVRQVADALAMRNGPSTLATLNLPLGSEVRVWREKGMDNKQAKPGWDGPRILLAIEGETCTVQMPHGPVKFRSTVVKPFRTKPEPEQEPPEEDDEAERVNDAGPEPRHQQQEQQEPRRGARDRVPPFRHAHHVTEAQEWIDVDEQFIYGILDEVYLSKKEQSDMELAVRLRAEGIITTPGAPFEASDNEEFDGLLGKGVFEFEQHDPEGKHAGVRIFNSRLVHEIKNKLTSPFEKTRLVIQAYNDAGKEMVLTQSPTIQRISQRLILALAPSLSLAGFILCCRDIIQAYTCSDSELVRLILAWLPKEFRSRFPVGTLMRVVKPLYGVPEAGTHWWATYYKHHKEKLQMVTSTYDPCLLLSSKKEAFGLLGMQVDDTFWLGNKQFADAEEAELQKAGLKFKPKQQLTTESDLDFNGSVLKLLPNNIMRLQQRGQSKSLKLATDLKSYREERARGAYIALTCQPEAAFDTSIAAQHQEPQEDDFAALNKRLQWQIDNPDRGITYIPIKLNTAKLFVFVDGSFANNKDMSSQIGYTAILATETINKDTFDIRGNLVGYSTTKSKRVTRSVLASELYGMVGGVDIGICLQTTLKLITDQLGMPNIPLILCTDSMSLYDCLVKLGTTKAEKRLMIDIMALRQSYERREIFEVRWIDGRDNPADAMTKANPNKALEHFLDSNMLSVRVDGWVER